MPIPSHQQDKINSVLALYRTLDKDIEEFKTATSLGCVNGCGRCCENPAVFVTVLEVLPLAYDLWIKGEAQGILERIRADRKAWCHFYQQDPLHAGSGRCMVYSWRPLICRMFGYATRKDKHGCPTLVTCSTMKDHCAVEYQKTTERLNDGSLQAPGMQEYAMQILNIDRALGTEQLPINEAVAVAIEKVGLLMRE